MNNDYIPSIKQLLSKVGEDKINKITVCRTPIQSMVQNALNVLSLGEFNKNIEKAGYDRLFHLFMILHTKSGMYRLEKNEIISFQKISSIPKAENKSITITEDLTINLLLDRTKKRMKSKYFSYAVLGNNCQNFLKAICNANNISTPEILEFIKQNTKDIFNNLGYLRKFGNTTVEIAGKVHNASANTADLTKDGLFGKQLKKNLITDIPHSKIITNGIIFR